jgi:hypothetical protein
MRVILHFFAGGYMWSRSFFGASWVLQLLSGFGLFVVSFYLQWQVLTAFMFTPLLALGLAISLEAAKVVAIVWHRYLCSISGLEYSWASVAFSAVFRIGLLLLSLLCSLLFLSNHLDRPLLADFRVQQLEKIDQSLRNKLTGNSAQLTRDMATASQGFVRQREALLKQSQQSTQTLEKRLELEMTNIVNGEFRGKRYLELERLLAQQRQTHGNLVRRLVEQENMRFEQLNKNSQRHQQQLYAAAEQDSLRVSEGSFDHDERVQQPHIVAFINTVEVLGFRLAPLQFVLGFSVLLSLLVELGIVLAFDTLTVVVLPLLAAQHQEQLKTSIYQTSLNRNAERERADYAAEVSRVRQRADEIMQQAESMMGKR